MSCQICFGILVASSNSTPKDESPYLKGALRALARIRTMMEQAEQEPELANLWLKTFVAFPTFDKPSKKQMDRLSFNLLGSTLIFLDEKEEQELTATHPLLDLQMLPTAWTQGKGAITPVQHIFTVALRAAGGSIMQTRAPRGNLVRRFRA